MPRATQIDALFQIDRASKHFVVGGIARRHALHARACVIVAIGAGLARRAGLALPQRFAIEHPQHAWIGGVVILDRLGIRRHEGVAGPPLALLNLGGGEGRGRYASRDQQRRNDYRAGQFHSTEMLAEAISANPLSPIHSKSNFPLSVATVKNETNGFAAIAGNRSARKISAPLKRQVKLVMMSRGINWPAAVWRKPVSMMCDIKVLISMMSPRLAFLGTLIRADAITSPLRCRQPMSPRHRR